MLAVMNIVGMDHSAQILASVGRSPSDALMHDDVVKDEIKYSVTADPDADGNAVGIKVHQGEVIEQRDRWKAEDHDKQVIFFQRVVVNGVMGFVPAPEESMHDVLVRKPGDELPEKESADNDQ